ncbi:MAG: ankyrin repeat domain-containing protein [Gammaproteobacteria bacterium]|nr:ankyrin repeat domain-containing protein [Gammaproteobacteria bacterium]
MRIILRLIALLGVLLSIGCQTAGTVGSFSKLGYDMAATKAHLAAGGDINGKDSNQWTMLMKTAIHNKPEITEYLLKAGANPNITDRIGRTPVFWAKSVEVVALLVQYGADLKVKDITGKNPLEGAQATLATYKKQSGGIWPKLIAQQQEVVDVLSGSASPKWMYFVKRGELDQLKTAVTKGVDLNEVDANGNTALHLAAEASHPAVVSYLISKKMPLLTENNQGKSALDLVRAEKNTVAKILSCAQNKYCRTVDSFEQQVAAACSATSNIKSCLQATDKDIHGVFMTAQIAERMSGYAFDNACKKFSYRECQKFTEQYANSSQLSQAKQLIAAFVPKGQALFATACGEKGTTAKCKGFVGRYPGLINEQQIAAAMLYLGQNCRLKEDGWIYKGSQCHAGLAHGTGEAVNQAKNLSFKGTFKNGQRTKGELQYDGQPMFDGTISDGRPSGVGICFHKNEPEECKFYKGKRVDVLYKQRLALASQEQKMDAKLAEMKKMQQQQNDRISKMQGQVNSAGQQSQGSTIGQEIGDYAMRKAGEKVMDKLFDKLF